MTVSAQAAAPQPESNSKWRVFLLVGVGVFLCTMDSSMVNVALPSIMRTFTAPLIHVQWVVLIYLLTITVSLLIWGVAADRFGRERIYLIGTGVFAAGSLCCAVAPSLAVLIGLRFVEGLGAAMMMAAGPAIIREAFPRGELGKGLGLVGIATSAGLMSGPVISGLLISFLSWRMIFVVTVPISLLLLLGGLQQFIGNKREATSSHRRQFDARGALLWALLVVSFILYAHFLPRIGVAYALLGGGGLVLLLMIFIRAEQSRSAGILPLHLFGKRYYYVGLLTAATSFGSLFVVLILMPFFLEYLRGLPADLVGLVMTAVPLTLCVVSPVSGMLYDRFGGRLLTTAGLAMSCGALVSLAFIEADTSLVTMCIRLAVLGMGQSMFLAPNTASLLTRISDEDAGVTAGLLATARNLGMLAGAAFAGIVFAAWLAWFSGGVDVHDLLPSHHGDFLAAFRATLLCAAVISLLAVFISWQRE